MNHRDLICSYAALAALSTPGLSKLFAQDIPAHAQANEKVPSILGAAILRAKSRGWPLLILNTPESESRQYLLGRMWGTYFSLATRKMLEDLALCEIVCAPDAQVLAELPLMREMKDWTDGIGLLLEPGENRPQVVPGPIVIPPWWKEGRELQDGMLSELNRIHARLHALIAPDRATIERRARQNRATLGDEEFAALGATDDWRVSGSWRLHAERVPAWLLLELMSHETERHDPLPILCRQAGLRLELAPEGSRWESPTEDCTRKASLVADLDPQGCTMPGGGGPPRGARFLHFWTDPETAGAKGAGRNVAPR